MLVNIIRCQTEKTDKQISIHSNSTNITTTRQPEAQKKETFPIANQFFYPVGSAKKHPTAKRDGDGWYNAQDFGKNEHLGEDWNGESGGSSDCGSAIYAAADGVVVLSEDLKGGWGNVIIIRHQLPDKNFVETLYGHLLERHFQEGDTVKAQELVGLLGDAAPPCGDNAPYYAHLHFELRTDDCPAWGSSGPGYAKQKKGWIDPSDFIDTFKIR